MVQMGDEVDAEDSRERHPNVVPFRDANGRARRMILRLDARSHIPPYEQGEKRGYDPVRARKLLLHRGEIERLIGKQAEKGLSLVPIRVYFTHGIAKLELGLGKGKRAFEKRQSIAKREHDREIEQALGRRR